LKLEDVMTRFGGANEKIPLIFATVASLAITLASPVEARG
jgi:hypothetical protein